MRVLILGASGMLGHALLDILGRSDHQVYGATRAAIVAPASDSVKLISQIDVLRTDDLLRAFEISRPDVVINAVGLIKQLEAAQDPVQTIPINTVLPHRLASLCAASDARLIHVSTDCVFSGEKGGYVESDFADARDLYGLSKYLGEVTGRKTAITLRTSIIGRERHSANGLVEWFLAAGPTVKGYANAIFSGLPTVVLAELIRDIILPRPELSGLYHVSADPINKLDLIRLISQVYGLSRIIEPVEEPRIDRSLNSDRFRRETGYVPQTWPTMIEHMRKLQG